MLELLEFEHALDEFLKSLELIAPTLRDLHQVTTKVVELGKGQALARTAVRDQATHIDIWICQFLGAFRQVRGAVGDWNITPARGESILPTSGKRPIPSD